jgi:hypothetical protein
MEGDQPGREVVEGGGIDVLLEINDSNKCRTNSGKKGHGSSYIPMRLAVNKSNSSMWLSTSSMNLATSSLFVYLDPSLQKTQQQKNKADPSLHPLVSATTRMEGCDFGDVPPTPRSD